MVITDSYRQLNRQLHDSNPLYGISGSKYVLMVRQIIKELGTEDVLDYGCGKRTLERALGLQIANYDPCIPGLDKAPEPHDIVTCTDVLEHIEPDCLLDVIADLHRLTKMVCFMAIHTGAADKLLPDGRNAHLTQQGLEWWLAKVRAGGFFVRPDHVYEKKWRKFAHSELFIAAHPQEPQ